MENQNNDTIMLDMIRQIQQTMTIFAQNQTLLFDGLKSLEAKFDAKFDKLDKKIDDNYAKLDKKIDDNYAKLDKKIDDTYAKLDKKIDDNYAKLNRKIDDNTAKLTEMINANAAKITSLEKQIRFLRDDIDTVYALETDSQNKLKKLL